MERVPGIGYEWTARVPVGKRHFLKMWLDFLRGRRTCIIVRLQITDEGLLDMCRKLKGE